MTKLSLSDALAHSGDPLLLVDTNGGVVWGNESATRLCPSGQLPQNLREILEEEGLRKVLATVNMASLDVCIKGKPGKLPLRQLLVVLDLGSADPDSMLFMLIFKSMQSDSQSLNDREEFLAMVTHDLKNPLGAIFGYSDVLMDTNAGVGMSPHQKDIVSRIRATAARSIDLVRNYQHLSQLSSLKGSQMANARLKPESIDLNLVIKNVVEYTWREDKSAPHFSINLTPEALPVRIERIHLDRVISNLFTNSLKYTPRDGTISISTLRMGTEAWMSIHNSGPGIPAQELPHIFNRYTRASSGRSKPGSGLGLYIVKALVDAANGQIEVKSSASEGTLFTLKFKTQ